MEAGAAIPVPEQRQSFGGQVPDRAVDPAQPAVGRNACYLKDVAVRRAAACRRSDAGQHDLAVRSHGGAGIATPDVAGLPAPEQLAGRVETQDARLRPVAGTDAADDEYAVAAGRGKQPAAAEMARHVRLHGRIGQRDEAAVGAEVAEFDAVVRIGEVVAEPDRAIGIGYGFVAVGGGPANASVTGEACGAAAVAADRAHDAAVGHRRSHVDAGVGAERRGHVDATDLPVAQTEQLAIRTLHPAAAVGGEECALDLDRRADRAGRQQGRAVPGGAGARHGQAQHENQCRDAMVHGVPDGRVPAVPPPRRKGAARYGAQPPSLIISSSPRRPENGPTLSSSAKV